MLSTAKKRYFSFPLAFTDMIRHDNIATLESTFVMEEIKHEYSVSV